MTLGPVTQVLDGVPWLWAEGLPQRNACAGFVRTLAWQIGQPALIHLFAETQWRLYVGGRFVAAGPAPFRKPIVTVDSIDLSSWLRPGDNEVFIIVRWFGMITKWALSDQPGLAVAIEVGGHRLIDAEGWKAYALRLLNPEPPRMSWAREPIEDLDMRHGDAAVLARFASEDYALGVPAALPAPARLIAGPARATTFRPRQVPPLTWRDVRPLAPPAIHRCNPEVFLIQDLARRLSQEHWSPAWDADLVDRIGPAGVRLDRRRGDKGWALTYDLRRVCAGDLVVEIECETDCTVDLGFTERFVDDRPEVTRNGSHYVARMRLGPGLNRCRLLGFHGFRWILLSLKDGEGRIVVRDLRARECHADLPYRDAFACSDQVVGLVYDISRRSVVLNTQAACYDCNTREVGAYWGDGVWIADLAGHLSGDFSHLRHLCRAAIDEFETAGVVNASLFGMGGCLIEYSLVPAEVLRRAFRFTGDRALAAETLPGIARIVADLETCVGDDGWMLVERVRAMLRARHPDAPDALLFLDHPGLGWHPRDSTAIDRRDVNAGLQLFWLQALQGLSEVARGIGADDRWGAQAERLRARIGATFRDPSTSLIADCRLADGTYGTSSQIVNALAITTGVLTGEDAQRTLAACIATDQRPEIAASTPYGYFFIAEAMIGCGMVPAAVRLLRQRFEPMLSRGATTTWEAFGGELHDSLNHAWSAVMPWLAYRGLMGLSAEQPGYARCVLRPALDALDHCRVRVVVPQGPLEVAWDRVGRDGRRLVVDLPPGVTASLRLPGATHEIHGRAAFDLVF